MDFLLKFNILGTESVGLNPLRSRGRHASKQVVSSHPPRKPGFKPRLATEFIDQVAVVVENRAVADHVRSVPRGIELRRNLRVENPELAFESRSCVNRKWRAARNFGDQFNVLTGLFQQRTDFVCERSFPHSVRADKREFQLNMPFEVIPVSSTDEARHKTA